MIFHWGDTKITLHHLYVVEGESHYHAHSYTHFLSIVMNVEGTLAALVTVDASSNYATVVLMLLGKDKQPRHEQWKPQRRTRPRVSAAASSKPLCQFNKLSRKTGDDKWVWSQRMYGAVQAANHWPKHRGSLRTTIDYGTPVLLLLLHDFNVVAGFMTLSFSVEVGCHAQIKDIKYVFWENLIIRIGKLSAYSPRDNETIKS